MAASIASVIAMAGDEIIMPENALMLVHNPWSFTMGNAAELRANAADLDKIQNNLVNIYKDRSGQTMTQIQNLMNGPEGSNGTLMTASEALAFGLVTAVEPNKQAAACIGADIWAGVPACLVKNEEDPEEDPEKKKKDAPEGESDPDEDPEKKKKSDPSEKSDPSDEDPEKKKKPEPSEATALKKQLDEANAATAAAKAEAAAANAKIQAMFDKGLSPHKEPVAGNTTWDQAKQICGGDYVKARKLYPLAYARYMEAETGKKGGK